ncbi:hypothetical protein HB837_15360 [Listeria innocua]|uniref:hypothetical protein n=1 Tax=Listeria innocua TaxID=1642 RepID=UPI0016283714|nr:hypothetical protein [Listeria innocua]MBC1353788.1 hypothetical protein [Listeria innocua]
MEIEVIANVNSIQQVKEILSEVEVLNENNEVKLTINITYLKEVAKYNVKKLL